MYAPPHPKNCATRCQPRTLLGDAPPVRWRKSSQRAVLVAIPYHQMTLNGIIICTPAGGQAERLHRTLGHNCITDRGFRRGLGRPVIIHVTAFRLLLRATVAEPDFMLIRGDLDDLELIIAAGIEQPALPDAGTRRGLRFVALAAVVDFRN